MSFELGTHVSVPGPIDIAAQHATSSELKAGYTATFHSVLDQPMYVPEAIRAVEGSDFAGFTNHGYFARVDTEYPDPEVELLGAAQRTAGMQLDLRIGLEYDGVTESTVHSVVDAWIQASAGKYKAPILVSAPVELGEETARYVAAQGHPVHWSAVSGEIEVNYARDLSEDYPDNFTSSVRATSVVGRDEDPAAREAYVAGDIQILESGVFDVRDLKLVLPIMLGLVHTGQLSMERFVDSVSTQPKKMLGLLDLSHQTVLGTREPQSETQISTEPYYIDGYGQFAGQLALGHVTKVTIDGRQRYSATDGVEPLTARRVLRPGVRI